MGYLTFEDLYCISLWKFSQLKVIKIFAIEITEVLYNIDVNTRQIL